MGISIGPLLVILAIVLLIFGAKKLKTLGSDLGGAVKGFKEAMSDDEGEVKKDEPPIMLKQNTNTEHASSEAQKNKQEDKV